MISRLLFTTSFLFICRIAVLGNMESNLDVCDGFEDLKLLDCSARGLTSLPQFQNIPQRYASLSMMQNLLTSVNITFILSAFPSLKHIDLRGNPLNCSRYFKQHIPFTLTIKTDCIHPSPTHRYSADFPISSTIKSSNHRHPTLTKSIKQASITKSLFSTNCSVLPSLSSSITPSASLTRRHVWSSMSPTSNVNSTNRASSDFTKYHVNERSTSSNLVYVYTVVGVLSTSFIAVICFKCFRYFRRSYHPRFIMEPSIALSELSNSLVSMESSSDDSDIIFETTLV